MAELAGNRMWRISPHANPTAIRTRLPTHVPLSSPVGSRCSTVEVARVRLSDTQELYEVRRALPSRTRQMVGPFIFFDQMGPAEFSVGQGIDVRPHPHINLATVTYLFDGEIIHRDSLGTMMPIRPGAVNWMTAGRGIVHSERTSPELKARGSRLFGLQTWVALPAAHEETDPSFAHYDETDLPVLEAEGKRVRVVVGHAWGLRSPVETFSDTIYADITLEPGAALPLDAAHEERAVYVVSGVVNIGDDRSPSGQLLVLRPGAITLRNVENESTRIVLVGGETMDGPTARMDERDRPHGKRLRRPQGAGG